MNLHHLSTYIPKQPILMAYAQHAGLANPSCQLYMLFYYIGPALAGFTLRCRRGRTNNGGGGVEGGCRHRSSSCCSRSRESRSMRNIISLPTASNSSYGATTTNYSTWDNAKDNFMDSGKHCCVDDMDVVGLDDDDDDEFDNEDDEEERIWPSRPLIIKASAIALFDIFAQSMVYTGTCVLLLSLLHFAFHCSWAW
jgi:hypothetical protein